MKLSVVLITKNEEHNIEGCLACVKWADEIIVVDSGSSDNTVPLARSITSQVFQIPFTDFATQKNKALGYAKGEWILLLDADERVPEKLADEIQRVISDPSKAETAYQIKRNTYFFGHRLHFSGTRNDAPIRLFPRGSAHYTQPVHETIVTQLPVETLAFPMEHFSTRDIAAYREKLAQYVDLEVVLMKKNGRSVFFLDFLVRPPMKFIQLYLLQLGFLDGIAGFQYAVLSSLYVFSKYRKFLWKKSA